MGINRLVNGSQFRIRTEPRNFYRPHEVDKRGAAKKAAPEEPSDAAKENVSLEFTDEVAIKAHLTKYQAGEPITACAEWCGVSYLTLRERWIALGAPITRTHADRAWAGPSTEATAEEETPSPAPDPPPQPQPEPEPEPEASPTATAVAATRPVEEVSVEVAELPAMLQLLQSLMASGADVHGSVRVKFDVEIDFPIGGE